MANSFKNSGVSGVSTNSGSPTTLYTSNDGVNPVKSILIELDIANTGTSAITASAILYDSSETDSYFIVKDAPIPSGSTLKVVSGQKIVLEGDDELRVYASSSTVDAIASFLQDVS